MNIQQALENIEFIPFRFPEEEILCIRAHKDEAIPVLLERVKDVVEKRSDLPDDYEAHFFAMFLLAEFRVHEAFPYLIRYLEFESNFADRLLGDSLTENFGSILASVATADDIPQIKKVIENTEIDVFQRLAALDVLQVFFAENAYNRDDYFAYLRYLLETFQEETTFTACVIADCEKTGAHEFFPVIEALFKADLVDEQLLTLPEFREALLAMDEEKAKKALTQSEGSTFVRDTVKILSKWACFNEKPDFGYKVGRNEPCPCDSGKKYKKCCGFL